ncbi:MAG: lipocalin family protein [Chromatiaceae bacterium]|jgi:apolipoprotein D and lipocalin family protein|nr:lipocalin family protein [Chromatiaceae bacterium]
MKQTIRLLLLLLLLILGGCTGIPQGIEPVRDFKLQSYLGKWYEVARLDHSFERGLSHVTAEYELRDDGGVRVINRGYSAQSDSWKEAEGKAYFVEGPDTGYLKVSFFGPFYGAYVVFELDHEHYQYALVSGPDRSYLWLLARNPRIDESTKTALLASAAAKGFDTRKLIFVEQD